MALTRKLREDTCSKIGIKQAAYYDYVKRKFKESGAPSMDVAGLLLAQDQGIDPSKPRYRISPKHLHALQEFQARQPRTIITVPTGTAPAAKRKLTQKNVPFKKLLKFEGKYPDLFFDKLEREINFAYNNPNLPNAVMMLSRKLIENLVYRFMQEQFRGPNILLYFDTNHNRAHDFSILLENLKAHKRDFPPDLHDQIERFLSLANHFRLNANASAHKIIEYLEKMNEVTSYKIPEMIALLLNLINGLP